MSLKIGLQLKGNYFLDLNIHDQIEIQEQIINIKQDPNYTMYRFYKTSFNKWIIVNAFCVPMKSNKSIWRD